MSAPIRVCFVCSGNICRSPTAEVVFTELIRAHGLGADVVADSAGTGDWHVGQNMDKRARAALVAGGYRPGRHSAKQFTVADFADRDLVVALDHEHVGVLAYLATATHDPAAAEAKVRLLRSFDPVAVTEGDLDVPDPYYGGAEGFGEVLTQIEQGCAGLLHEVRTRLPSRTT